MPEWARLLRRKLGALRVGSERRESLWVPAFAISLAAVVLGELS